MPIDAVSRYLEGVGARRLAEGEWGLTVADEHPLDIGIRVADGLVRIQAFAVPAADAPASEDVLHWNRASRLVRFSRTRGGDVWVQADLFAAAADAAAMDKLLGLVVEASRAARAAAYPDRDDLGVVPHDVRQP
jgi:Putative bacterial sensory transduction regulator